MKSQAVIFFGFEIRKLYGIGFKRKFGSVAAATAAAADSVEDRAQRSVFAHAVGKGGKDRPAAARKDVRREHVPAGAENEQDNENPKTAIAL